MKKRIICLLLAAALAAASCGCGRKGSSVENEQTEMSEVQGTPASENETETEIETETETETQAAADTEESELAEYVGIWKLNTDVTGEHLSSHDSLESLYGDNLSEVGAELSLTEDGSIAYYIGDQVNAEGTCTITNGWLLAKLDLTSRGEASVLSQILAPSEIGGVTYLAMVLDDETLYWAKDDPNENSSHKDYSAEELEALADVSKEVIDDYGTDGEYSVLTYSLDGTTLVECEDYYLIFATFGKPVVVPGNLKIGDSLTFTINELTGEEETVIYKEEGILVNEETGMEYYYFPDNDEVTLYCDSDDRVDSQFYEGALRIRKDAVTGAVIMEESEPVTKEGLSEEISWFNAVSFDEEGYVTALMFVGD